MSFEFSDAERSGESVRGLTTTRNGDLVILLQLRSGNVTDDDFNSTMNALRRFVQCMKKTPICYHMVVDTHRTLEMPVSEINTINTYLMRKERYLRNHVLSTTYLIQGRLSATFVQTMSTMFESWCPQKTIQLHPQQGSSGELGLPEATTADVYAFMDSVRPPRGS